MDEITIDGKVYVSSKQAAKITGYAKDYVGQLCREGRVEARLVGRNWYVLEDAIREHRFGVSEEEVPVPAPQAIPSRLESWQSPQYAAEVPAIVPDLEPKTPSSADSSPAIADMQSAWKEWFEEKRPMQASLPDGSEDFKDEYLPVVLTRELATAPEDSSDEDEEVPVAVRATNEAPEPHHEAEEAPIEEEGEVALHRSYTSFDEGERVPQTSVPVVDLTSRSRAIMHAKKEAQPSGKGVLRAVFMVLAVVAVLIAIVGTGNANRLISGTSFDYGVQKVIFDYLGGTRTYESSL